MPVVRESVSYNQTAMRKRASESSIPGILTFSFKLLTYRVLLGVVHGGCFGTGMGGTCGTRGIPRGGGGTPDSGTGAPGKNIGGGITAGKDG